MTHYLRAITYATPSPLSTWLPTPAPGVSAYRLLPRVLYQLGCVGWLLLAAPRVCCAQTITNNGDTLFVNTGGMLTVNGDYSQTSGALLRIIGTARVNGAVQAASGSTLDLSTGELTLTQDLSAASATTTATTGTLRLTGTVNQTVSLGSGTVGQLVVNKPTAGGNRVDLPTTLTTRTGVTLTAGLVRTASTATLILPAGTTVTGEGPGQYVQGNLRVTRAAVAGTSAVDFSNGVVINPNGNSLGNVTVTRAAGLQQAGTSYAVLPGGSPTNSIDRIWTILPQTQPAAGTPATLTMSWVADDDGGLSPASSSASAQAFRRETSATTFAAVGSAQEASARRLSVATTRFSTWTVSAAAAPLPVELVAFAVQRLGTTALLTWATASELNSAYFAVEASVDGTAFQALGRVAAHGTSAQRQAYTFTDAPLATYDGPRVYYRLRQVDLNGTTSFSPVRTLALTGDLAAFQAVAWPNPLQAGTLTQLTLSGGRAAPLELTLHDATGRELARRTVAAGTTTLSLPELEGLASGLYLLRVRQGMAQQELRLVHP